MYYIKMTPRPDMTMNYEELPIINEVEEEDHSIDWKFIRKQMVRTILFPLVIVGLVNV